MTAALLAKGLSKRYGGTQALDDVGFELQIGEVHGLCGENGAGKSTLVKVLGGYVVPDSGKIEIGGKTIKLGQRPDPSQISIVHQELSIVPHLTVLDNVMMGAPEVGTLYVRSRYRAAVRKQLDAVGLTHIDVDRVASTLSLAEQQLVEIARGVARGARVLLLDEPTATLSDAEISKVFKVVRALKEGGATIVIISHRLDEIFALTDRVTVFRSGRHIWTRNTKDVDPPELVRAMIGRDVVRGGMHAASGASARKTQLQIRDWSLRRQFGSFNMAFGEGETVAIVGQLGSGADSLVESLAGLHPSSTGRLSVGGEPFQLRTINDAYRAGIAYVSEDRAGKGIFLDATIEVNITAQVLDQLSPAGVISIRAARDRAAELAKDFQIDAHRLSHDASTLSGGNQQKVSLAKAVALKPRVLLLNEPTRGVDIGARSEIYSRLHAMTAAGMTLIFYSTDLEEVMEVADRVITVYRGELVNDRPRSGITADDVLHDILHGPERSAA
ncbi:sugar ABC transporter ATP-binding protein [Variovorax sp. J31P207]|uniref:sugar ABC transporter ATP-binding protein n=1 Tax=Variovorax sp. J31P207 TaxID=3053510 RepID=UPI0025790910|nr:sugar ABC transporter ATP-binding protein [Variovorax sp. J31P207]MDM0071509.1 sugar ABC transporter ATP-binding protein [Variovorax sp. J31P207]